MADAVQVIPNGCHYPTHHRRSPMIIEQKIRFKAADTDLPGEYTWNEAVAEAKKLGWRLPTREELSFMYQQKDSIGGFASDCYWSSSEYDAGNAWSQYFPYGSQYATNKVDYGRVRLVRDVKAK